jgi:hypothetical protein
MINPTHRLFLCTLIAALTLAPGYDHFLAPAQAREQILAKRFRPPAKKAKKRRTMAWRAYVRPTSFRVGGMARRSDCPDGKGTLTALIPPDKMSAMVNEKSESPIDRTSSDYPSFLAIVPKMEEPTEAKFTLQRIEGQELKQIYSHQFTIDGRAGIVGLQTPKSLPPLQVGQRYLWQMRLVCGNPNRPDKHPVVGGWVERVDPNNLTPSNSFNPKELMKELAATKPEDRPTVYAELGLWQDAIGYLAALKLEKPNDRQIAEDWQNLLSQNEMDSFVQLPILGMF